ncbi:Lrp/AsnC family transcriptional regulator [Oecophyllibacter saccharovorans]|uniref:Lrp/AsnC family transcriptional regulator n=2 Tax=Oecophyllibacter saccharovorans TaxID=2558360 RepID=A0A506UR08_9PROT|nr:Lrp/AsnC family transcriptional regulator [Oecophyllibacter saccharovorans]QDH14647.1 Lrp/AsnC family transcriptional regulator [Oecophyllibacter saccharovorans]TPW35785.1 Lrp/AsnC family transcriptional regulator [Oecophyllibacter saccharovorans]
MRRNPSSPAVNWVVSGPDTERVLELDETDRMILSELQRDGRMTNVELARRIGMSAPPCLRRVRRLEELGVIRGFHAELDAAQLGWPVSFFVLVGLDSQKSQVLEEFEQTVIGWPELQACHMLNGAEDFLLHVLARDAAHQQRLIHELTEMTHVVRLRSFQDIRTLSPHKGVPL